MVLEYCEMSLKDWLGGIKSINSNVLEDMSIFTMNIANGVKHLHENQVRRKNLLLANPFAIRRTQIGPNFAHYILAVFIIILRLA